MDGTLHGEVKATSSNDRNGYQYYLSSLTAGHSYDVQVKVRDNSAKFCFKKANAKENFHGLPQREINVEITTVIKLIE